MTTINSAMMKRINRKKVLEALRYYEQGMTKQEIAQWTKLTIASVGNIVSELEELGLIKTIGFAESSVGRKPAIYKINPDAFYVLGLSIRVGRCALVITNLEGKVICQDSARFLESDDVADVLGRLVNQVRSMMNQSGIAEDQFLGIGISSPGPLDPNQGTIHSPPHLPKWKSIDICRFFEQELQMPSFLEKDANAAALCELWYGEGKQYNNLLYVMVDAGIGSGIVINGEIYRGKSNVSGEIGHGTIDIDGPRCICGNYGCLEVMASGAAIVRRAREEIRRGFASVLVQMEEELDLNHILEGFKQGDELSRYLLQESSRYVGIALADKINFLNPDLVVIGGDIPEAVEPYFEWVKEIAMKRIFQETAMGVKMIRATYGSLSEVMGSTTRVVENLFKLDKKRIPY